MDLAEVIFFQTCDGQTAQDIDCVKYLAKFAVWGAQNNNADSSSKGLAERGAEGGTDEADEIVIQAAGDICGRNGYLLGFGEEFVACCAKILLCSWA